MLSAMTWRHCSAARLVSYRVRTHFMRTSHSIDLLDTVAGLGQWTVQGLLELARKGTLNDQFPELKPLTIREMLDQCWKGK